MSGSIGERYQPLHSEDLPKIDKTVRAILSNAGMSEAPNSVIHHITAAGGHFDDEGRLYFSLELIENAPMTCLAILRSAVKIRNMIGNLMWRKSMPVPVVRCRLSCIWIAGFIANPRT